MKVTTLEITERANKGIFSKSRRSKGKPSSCGVSDSYCDTGSFLPNRTRHLLQYQKKQYGICRVKQQIGQMYKQVRETF